MITVYGIPNCSSVKKARDWLSAQGYDYHFHDFKKHGVPADALQHWMEALGWEKVLNKSGMTWRKTDDNIKAEVQDAASASRFVQAHSSAIKRPVIDWGDGRLSIGYTPDAWS